MAGGPSRLGSGALMPVARFGLESFCSRELVQHLFIMARRVLVLSPTSGTTDLLQVFHLIVDSLGRSDLIERSRCAHGAAQVTILCGWRL